MLRSNDVSLDGPYYRRLTDSQMERIHQATLEVLEGMGVRFRDGEALEIFQKGGAYVDGDLVRIPSTLVEWALRTAPKRLTLYDQKGNPAIRLEGRCSYYGNGSDLLYVIDHRTGERREPTLQDVHEAIFLLDSLDHFDFVMSEFLPRNVPVDKAERLQMQAMLKYTDKPILYVTTDLTNTQDSVAMAEAVAGGPEALRARPFAANYINISNPLRHNPESIQKLIMLSRKRLPFTYRPALVTRGISGPVTGAGFLAVNNAASLAGLALSQLVCEGAPFIRDSCAGGTFDMRHMVGQHAAPEIRGFNEELLHFYGLPGFGIGGVTGAKAIDAQAASESALTLITSTLAGAQLVHDVGYMDNGTTGSLVQLALCSEMIGWIKAYMQPLVVNEETIALDTIREVVSADGDFLGTRHTARHFKEDYAPKLYERRRYDAWAADGGQTLYDRALAHVEDTLSNLTEDTLTVEQARMVQSIVDADR